MPFSTIFVTLNAILQRVIFLKKHIVMGRKKADRPTGKFKLRTDQSERKRE